MTVPAFSGPGVPTPGRRSDSTAGPGEVIVDVAYAASGAIGRPLRDNTSALAPRLGIAGHVRALGAGVAGLSYGEAVAALAAPAAVAGSAGGVRISASLVVPLETPYGAIPLDGAAAAVTSGPTAILALLDLGRLQPEDPVIVHGATGALGRMTVRLAYYLGARPLIGVVGSAADRARATSLGCTHALVASEDVPSQVRALTGGLGAQIIVDPVGGPLRLATLAALRPFGRLIVAGQASTEPDAPVSTRDLSIGNHAVLGLNLGALATSDPRRFQRAARAVFTLIARGAIAVDVAGVRLRRDEASGHQRLDRGAADTPAMSRGDT